MSETTNNVIREGDYVIVKRQNFKKVHKVSTNSVFNLGKEQVQMNGIIGKRFWMTFEVIPSGSNKLINTLRPVDKAELFENLKLALPKGIDNRLINDDGSSQQLSKEEILDLRKSGKSSREIVSTLIENSTSFTAKTEYSQEKYIRKKEKKYFHYLTICKPTIQLLQEIYFLQDCSKISSLRIDTLAQILSYSGVKSDGLYLLYDSGSSGLPAASMLSRIGANTNGVLIHIYPGYEPQIGIVQAMNFPSEQLDRLFNLSISAFIKPQKITLNAEKLIYKKSTDNSQEMRDSVIDLSAENFSITKSEESLTVIQREVTSEHNLKRKNSESIQSKIPEKQLRISHALDILNTEKAESLVIIAKEHPLNIIETLISFVRKSKPFVIFHLNREPLQDTYIALKQNFGVVNLRLFSTFLRSHQILTDRTHPDILTHNLGGYILTGYLIQ